MTQVGAQAMAFVLAFGLVATSCAERAGVKMLHERPAYAGELEVTRLDAGSASRPPLLSGDLSFDRAKGVFQLTIRAPKTVSYLRQETGAVEAFEDGKARAASAEEREMVELARALSDPGSLEEVEAGEKSYRVKVAGRWYSLALVEQQTHGWR